MNWRSSGHLFDGSSIFANAEASAATDFRTALSGSEANLSSSNPLVLSRAFFLTFFQSLPIFFLRITAAICLTAGFSLRLTCVVSSPTLSGRFKTGFRASSACLMRVVSGAVKAASISPSCWSFWPSATACRRPSSWSPKWRRRPSMPRSATRTASTSTRRPRRSCGSGSARTT